MIGGRILHADFECQVMLERPFDEMMAFKAHLHRNGVPTQPTSHLCPDGHLGRAGWNACPYHKPPTR